MQLAACETAHVLGAWGLQGLQGLGTKLCWIELKDKRTKGLAARVVLVLVKISRELHMY